MAIAQPITDTHIQDFIIQAIKSVCTTMMHVPVGFVKKASCDDYEAIPGQSYVIGSVGFNGEINGIVNLCIPNSFAYTVSANILGMTHAEVVESGDEVVRDVVGEITNMTVGGFKNALCDIGFPCRLTLPTVVRGDGLKIASLSGIERHVFQFDCAGHRLIADIQLKHN
jgi:chemotaxis protein CheX